MLQVMLNNLNNKKRTGCVRHRSRFFFRFSALAPPLHIRYNLVYCLIMGQYALCKTRRADSIDGKTVFPTGIFALLYLERNR